MYWRTVRTRREVKVGAAGSKMKVSRPTIMCRLIPIIQVAIEKAMQT